MSDKIENNQTIIVDNFREGSKATLIFYHNIEKVFETEAFIEKNGVTTKKIEGDGKTPRGIFELGLVFGTHSRKNIELSKNIQYIKINKNLYWIDDIDSKYYNQLIDVTKVVKDWKSAEHLTEYTKQYEYAIEIKANSKNIIGKR